MVSNVILISINKELKAAAKEEDVISKGWSLYYQSMGLKLYYTSLFTHMPTELDDFPYKQRPGRFGNCFVFKMWFKIITHTIDEYENYFLKFISKNEPNVYWDFVSDAKQKQTFRWASGSADVEKPTSTNTVNHRFVPLMYSTVIITSESQSSASVSLQDIYSNLIICKKCRSSFSDTSCCF